MKKKFVKLIESIAIDLIGSVSYFFPGIGETFDLIWSPISALLIYKLYKKPYWALFGGIEELLPFTDFIPTATILWFIENRKK
jgi:hypothetical protein